MKSILILHLLTVVILGASEDISTATYKQLAIDQFRSNKPDLAPDIHFVLTEYQWNNPERLPIRLFLLRCLSPNGKQFNEMQFFTDGTKDIHPISSAFGGHGIMSVVSSGSTLFITNSWGSGRHRTELMAITPKTDGGYQLVMYPEVLLNDDAGLSRSGDTIQLRRIRYFGYANHEILEPIGIVSILNEAILVDEKPNRALGGTPLRYAP